MVVSIIMFLPALISVVQAAPDQVIDINSVLISEANLLPDNTWQNSNANPVFSLSNLGIGAGSGDTHWLYLYWGTDANGTSSNQISPTDPYNYDPAPVEGTYYLRIQLEDNSTVTSGWRTVFTYRYDVTPPYFSSVIEAGGALNDTWQNSINTPTFNISIADAGVGGSSYSLYWGQDPNGTDTIPGVSPFTPSATPLSDGTYYLRATASDSLGNSTGWQTIFTFRLDTLDPDPVLSVTETNGIQSSEWGSVASPSFTWVAPSGASTYNIYWGADPTSPPIAASHLNQSIPFSAPASPGTDNYLFIQSEDEAGNTSAWSALLFTYWYDDTAPTPVTAVTETDNGLQSGVCTTLREATFTWTDSTTTGSPLKGYYYYWGDHPDPLVVTPYQHIDLPPLNLSLPKGGKYYLKMASHDEAGNISAWNTVFILCNGDDVDLVEADVGGSLELWVPDYFVQASYSFPGDSYQIFVDPNWVSQDIWVRVWYPPVPGHRDPTITKLAPYNHKSFNLAVDLASDTSTLTSLTHAYTLTLTYSEGSILAIKENTLKVYWWNGDEWDALGSQTLDAVENTITAYSTKTGEFLVMGDPIPVEEQLTIIAGSITFGNIPLTGRKMTITGSANPWIVFDGNYEDSGWYVTIKGTDFLDGASHTIPARNLTIQIPPENINVLVGTLPPNSLVTDPTEMRSSDMTILTSPIGANVGRYSISPIFKLEIPAETYGGTYTSQQVVTLIVGPFSP